VELVQAGGEHAHPGKAEASWWIAGKDVSVVPLSPERVVEVRYDHMEGSRFRRTTQFVPWRPGRHNASRRSRSGTATHVSADLRPTAPPTISMITGQ
jgi:ATP-dependent DNA ligase